MKGVAKAAKKANGLSRMCETCTIKGRGIICSPEMRRACTDAFVEGFKKGSKWAEKQLKNERDGNYKL